MPYYLVEHVVPGAGKLVALELQSIAHQCTVALIGLEGQPQWLYSTITADRMVCLFFADDEAVVRDHARCSGLPVQRISAVSAFIGPTLAAPGLAATRIDGLNMALTVLPGDSDKLFQQVTDTKSK